MLLNPALLVGSTAANSGTSILQFFRWALSRRGIKQNARTREQSNENCY